MSAFRLTPAIIFASAVIALLQAAPIAFAQETSQPAPAPKAQPQTPAAAPKRNQAPLPTAPETLPPTTTAGCAWVGKRVVLSLLRDDVVTAQDFDRIYQNFACSPDHLRTAFDCSVASGALPTAAETQTRVDSCWADPKFDTKSAKMAPATDTPTSLPDAKAQPKSGAGKGTSPAAGANGGSTPNYPAPKPR